MERYKIDLHMHTVISDGTDTPAEILARVKEAGITHFAVTDHDATDGCGEILRLLKSGDPAFVSGVEFSCEDEEGKYHVLGYGYDLSAPSVRELVRTCHDYRLKKVQQRVDWLKSECGLAFSPQDEQSLFALRNPGKPHVANMMVRYGYAPTKTEAFAIINRFKSKEKRIRPEVAVRAILDAKGIPVLAHPSYGSGDELIVGKDMERRLDRLMAYGIQGVEAIYSGFSKSLRDELLTLAERYGLYVTAGSDYHGANKLVRLGDVDLSGLTAYPDGLSRFLQDVFVEWK